MDKKKGFSMGKNLFICMLYKVTPCKHDAYNTVCYRTKNIAVVESLHNYFGDKDKDNCLPGQ